MKQENCMKFKRLKVNQNAVDLNTKLEETMNTAVRGYDQIMETLLLGGRKSDYNDLKYEFDGGANDELRRKHYDKSLKYLWKAEKNAPWSTFSDCTEEEKTLLKLAEQSLSDLEKVEVKRMKSDEFKNFLNQEYTKEEKQAIVNILSLIGHGEAYAWLVSNEVLRDVESTGAKAAVTMQVMEEAKHFVVLRELIYAFDVEVPRMPVWLYLILEGTLKSEGLEKFFGMNVLVEAFAMSMFGSMSSLPGLEILTLFHRDESRHTGLPTNYFKTKPMTWFEKVNPFSMMNRLRLFLPAIPLAMNLEKDFAVLGMDVFEFIGSMGRKIINLAYKVGFYLPIPKDNLKQVLNAIFNSYCKVMREDYKYVDFLNCEATTGEEELEIEKEVFQLVEAA